MDDNLSREVIEKIYSHTKSLKIKWHPINRVEKLALFQDFPFLFALELKRSYAFNYNMGTFYLFKGKDEFVLCFRKDDKSEVTLIDNLIKYNNELRSIYECIIDSRKDSEEFIKEFMENF